MDHTNFKYNVAVLIHWGVSVNKAIIQHYILKKISHRLTGPSILNVGHLVEDINPFKTGFFMYCVLCTMYCGLKCTPQIFSKTEMTPLQVLS